MFILYVTCFVHAVFRKSPLRVFGCTWMRIGTLMDWMKTPTWYNLLYLFCFFLALCGAGALILLMGVSLCNAKGQEWKPRQSQYGFFLSRCHIKYPPRKGRFGSLKQEQGSPIYCTARAASLGFSCPYPDIAQTAGLAQTWGRLMIDVAIGKGHFSVFLSSQTSLVRWEPGLKTSPNHFPSQRLLTLPRQPDR